jgi:Tol biopolymer transport system component
MQRDGSDQRQLTVDAAMDVSPRVTPDNRYIVFISNRSGAFQVWRMNIDGSNQIQLTKGGPKNYLAISPIVSGCSTTPPTIGISGESRSMAVKH